MEKALFEVGERHIAGMAGLGTAFSPTLTPGDDVTGLSCPAYILFRTTFAVLTFCFYRLRSDKTL